MADGIQIMGALRQQMTWLEQNQEVLAGNIARSDTPGAQPMELKKPDFKAMLQGSTSLGGSSGSSTRLALTSTQHMTAGGMGAGHIQSQPRPQKKTFETSPSGNSIVQEEQLLKMQQNFVDHRFATNLYQKNVSMINEALRTP